MKIEDLLTSPIAILEVVQLILILILINVSDILLCCLFAVAIIIADIAVVDSFDGCCSGCWFGLI
jgi:hypothetical protein